jgi:hypothetical protein
MMADFILAAVEEPELTWFEAVVAACVGLAWLGFMSVKTLQVVWADLMLLAAMLVVRWHGGWAVSVFRLKRSKDVWGEQVCVSLFVWLPAFMFVPCCISGMGLRTLLSGEGQIGYMVVGNWLFFGAVLTLLASAAYLILLVPTGRILRRADTEQR